MGPVTQAGCGALCPAYDRGCFGCFGPSESAKPEPRFGPFAEALHA
jgi:coenzyme F420-reducing hydrogenase gamma subunit